MFHGDSQHPVTGDESPAVGGDDRADHFVQRMTDFLRVVGFHGRIEIGQIRTAQTGPVWLERLRSELDAAVARHLLGDVPVGLFLSGGVDSSAIAVLASRHYGSKLRTYSAGFDFTGGPDELPAARRLATSNAPR